MATLNETPDHEHHAAADSGAVHVHPMSPWVLLGVYAVLVVLTVATVAVTAVDLGPLNIFVALGIAVAKAALVVLFFMHLLYDSPFNGVIFITSLVFIAVFLAITMLDSGQYKQNDEPPGVRQVISSQTGV